MKEIGILTGLRLREVGSPGEFDRLSDEELQDWIAQRRDTFIGVALIDQQSKGIHWSGPVGRRRWRGCAPRATVASFDQL